MSTTTVDHKVPNTQFQVPNNQMENGWYPDPQAQGVNRYWDGTAWTNMTAAAPAAGMPPAPGMLTAMPPVAVPASTSMLFTILALVSGAVAIFFFPVIFGPLGMIFAAIGIKKNQKYARVALFVALGCMVIGMALGLMAALILQGGAAAVVL